MALRQWSSEIYTAEFRELQASTFCCSRDGRLGLLAGAISSMSVVFFASNHPWYWNISTRKEKSWPSLYGAAQRTGETNRKEQQVTFSLSLSSVDLCLCQKMGGGRWPMEPKPAVWKPHRSLLQWQGELQCSSRCKTIFQEKRSDNKSFIGGGLPVDGGWLCSGRTNQGTHSPGDVPEY